LRRKILAGNKKESEIRLQADFSKLAFLFGILTQF